MIAGIVLAAGSGVRYRAMTGRDKLTDPIPPPWPGHGTPVILAAIAAMTAALDRVVTIVRPDNQALIALLKERGLTYLTVQTDGLGLTLAAAVEQTPTKTGWMVTLGDMPFIQTGTIAALAARLTPTAIVAPFCGNRTGHPVGFGSAFGAELAALKGDHGGRALLKSHQPLLLTSDDSGTITDMDAVYGLTGK